MMWYNRLMWQFSLANLATILIIPYFEKKHFESLDYTITVLDNGERIYKMKEGRRIYDDE